MLVYLNQISFLFLDCIIFSKSVYHQYYLIPYKWRQWYILDLWAHLIVIKMQFCRLDIFFPFWSFNNYMIFLCGSLDQACFRCNITVVTIYASLGEEALCHSLNEVSLPLSLSNLVCSVMLSGCTLLGFFYIICQKRINYDNLGEDSGKGGQIFCWHIYGYEHAGRDIWYVNILHNIFKLTWNAKPWDNQIQQKIGKKKERERKAICD